MNERDGGLLFRCGFRRHYLQSGRSLLLLSVQHNHVLCDDPRNVLLKDILNTNLKVVYL